MPSALIDVELLAIGKRAGLAFSEINELRVQDLLDYVNLFTGGKVSRARNATQQDIDAFYAG